MFVVYYKMIAQGKFWRNSSIYSAEFCLFRGNKLEALFEKVARECEVHDGMASIERVATDPL